MGRVINGHCRFHFKHPLPKWVNIYIRNPASNRFSAVLKEQGYMCINLLPPFTGSPTEHVTYTTYLNPNSQTEDPSSRLVLLLLKSKTHLFEAEQITSILPYH